MKQPAPFPWFSNPTIRLSHRRKNTRENTGRRSEGPPAAYNAENMRSQTRSRKQHIENENGKKIVLEPKTDV